MCACARARVCVCVCVCSGPPPPAHIFGAVTMQRAAVCVFTAVEVSNLHIDLLMGFQIINCLDDTRRYPEPSGGNSIAVNKYQII